MRNLTIIFSLTLIPILVHAATLAQYLDVLRDSHPLFKSEELAVQVEQERRDGLLGGEDWFFTARPAYEYNEPIDPTVGVPYETRNAMLDVGISRSFWASGGRLELGYSYDNQKNRSENSALVIDGQVIDISRPDQFFANAASLSYRQPLLKNRGGAIDSLPYDLQAYTVEQAALLARENQEDFLLRMGLRFLDWIGLTEERRIGLLRLDLAREDLARNEEKFEENIIEKVDLLRAEDAVLATEQALKRVESQLAAVRGELVNQAQGAIELGDAPEYELSSDPDAASGEVSAETVAALRRMKVLDLRLAQLEREQSGLVDNRRAELDLIVFGNLKDGAEEYSDSVDFDSPGAGVALAYSRPLRNRAAQSDYQRSVVESSKVAFDRDAAGLDLLAAASALTAEIDRLREVLELNRRQIETAASKTKEEQRLYEQGRNQFTFVLQSQDDEARAQLNYARNAVALRKLALQLDSVLDRLVPDID